MSNSIIYYRKSTDRDNYQKNTLEYQLNNCRKVARDNNLDIFSELKEKRSAKIERTRPEFQKLIKTCKTGKIDYIIADEPNRLSRNTLDGAEIINLLDKKFIKGVYVSGRLVTADSIDEKFMLTINFGIGKMDNEYRSKDVKNKMKSCIEKQGRFLGKVPFGYRNITIKKGHKDIVVDELEAKVVQDIFSLRIENKAYVKIAEFIEDKYGDDLKISLKPNRLQKLIGKKFYYGVFTWDKKEISGSHTPIISKETYDLANQVGRGVYEHKSTLVKRERKIGKYPLKGFIKDSSGMKLTAFTKKGIEYYGHQYRSTTKVCINGEKLFAKVGEYIKENESTNETLKSIDKDLIMLAILNKKDSTENLSQEIENKILILKGKQDKLLDMQLESTISKEKYIGKNNELEDKIQDLEYQKKSQKNEDFEEKTKIMLELAGSLYQSYNVVGNDTKTKIIKKLMLELFIDNKKELRIEDSPLFQSSKMLLNSFGIPRQDENELLESCLIQ